MQESNKSIKSDLKKLDSISEKSIDYSTIAETDEKFWATAEVFVAGKQAISLRVDEDVLSFFKSRGKGYQTFMNKVLRQYMETHQVMGNRGDP